MDDPRILERLRGLAIPPAWMSVWASADADSSVQATGVDGRGRTQYSTPRRHEILQAIASSPP